MSIVPIDTHKTQLLAHYSEYSAEIEAYTLLSKLQCPQYYCHNKMINFKEMMHHVEVEHTIVQTYDNKNDGIIVAYRVDYTIKNLDGNEVSYREYPVYFNKSKLCGVIQQLAVMGLPRKFGGRKYHNDEAMYILNRELDNPIPVLAYLLIPFGFPEHKIMKMASRHMLRKTHLPDWAVKALGDQHKLYYIK